MRAILSDLRTTMEGSNSVPKLRNGVKEDEKRWIVTLNKYEQGMIEKVTADKFGIEDVRGIQNRQTDYFRRRDGFAAELAFCKLFNVYRDFDMQYLGYDVVITLGEERRTVDIKQTPYNEGRLLADMGGKICDLYVLMIGQFPTFIYRGSIPGAILCRAENIETIGGKQFYAAQQSKLSMEFFY